MAYRAFVSIVNGFQPSLLDAPFDTAFLKTQNFARLIQAIEQPASVQAQGFNLPFQLLVSF
jgi:hypothetical protein